MLIARPDGGIDGQMFKLLQTEFSIDDAYDMLEARNVHASWMNAEIMNKRELAGGQ